MARLCYNNIMQKIHYDGPIVLAIMDGVGLRSSRSGNAFRQAHTEFLDHAMSNYLNIPLAASGEAVGILPGQMGNSEVGHNALGAGQIIKQGIAQVEAAFVTGDIWQSKAWKGAMEWLGVGGRLDTGEQSSADERLAREGVANSPEYLQAEPGPNHGPEGSIRRGSPTPENSNPRSQHSIGTLHFCGIFSDGGTHSDIRHLEQMIQTAYDAGVRRIRIHALFDGRDVPPQSALKYVKRIEDFCASFKDADFRIASGVGRMVGTADRYENDWGMVKLGYDLMVDGTAPRAFTSVTEAIETLRREDPKVIDQYLPPFVIIENTAASSALSSRADRAKASTAVNGHGAKPIGRIEDGDAMIYYDFRADRAVEIAKAFTLKDFDKFDRQRFPNIYFAGLTEYDADMHIPEHTLVPPIEIHNPLNVFLGQNHISQLAVSETVKFGHVTYYFNGNSYDKAPGEQHIVIESDTSPLYNQRPWMKSAEITDTVLDQMENFKFIRINYPNGDMVGHFAELEPTIIAMEAVDLQLARLAQKVDQLGGMMIITADHGNAEELIDENGVPKTSHTTNPVPCIFYDNTPNAKLYHSANLENPGLSNVAATIATLFGLPDYPASWNPPLIKE